MKRLIICFGLTVLLLSLAVVGLCAGQNYSIDALYMHVDVPQDWVVFMRDVDPNDPMLMELGVSKEVLERRYRDKNIYFNAVNREESVEITIAKVDNYNAAASFVKFSATELNEAARVIAANVENAREGVLYTSYEIYRHPQINFIVFDLQRNEDGKKAFGRQYYTIINGQVLNITLSSYERVLTENDAQMLREFMQSLEFTRLQAAPSFNLNSSMGLLIVGGGAALVVVIILILVKRKKRRGDAVSAKTQAPKKTTVSRNARAGERSQHASDTNKGFYSGKYK